MFGATLFQETSFSRIALSMCSLERTIGDRNCRSERTTPLPLACHDCLVEYTVPSCSDAIHKGEAVELDPPSLLHCLSDSANL